MGVLEELKEEVVTLALKAECSHKDYEVLAKINAILDEAIKNK